MSSLELSRELIALARQGGATIQELRERRRAAAGQAAAAAAGTTGGKKPDAEMMRSNSVPSMGATMRSTANGTRRGGGWATGKGNDIDLSKFKEKMDQLLANKQSLDYCEKPFCRTALWEAVWKNHEGIVKLLASKGANLAAADYQGRTPLHEAAFYGHVRLLEFLLDKGHPINCEDIFGQTPLFRAVEGGRHEVVKMLVERGAHTNHVDHDNVTAHHVAAFKGMPVLAEYLLYSGATKNRFGPDEPAPGLWPGASGALRSSGAVTLGATKRGSRSPLKAGATLMFGDTALPSRRIL